MIMMHISINSKVVDERHCSEMNGQRVNGITQYHVLMLTFAKVPF